MKKIIVAIFLIGTTFSMAQSPKQQTIKIKGTRLAYPLISRWITEFRKVYPHITVTIAHNAPSDSVDFIIAAYPLLQSEIKPNQEVIAVAEYVQILIVNSKRPGLEAWQKTGITEQELGQLFFPSAESKAVSSSYESPIHAYVRDRPVCAVKAFANHFGADVSKVNGQGVNGDDQTLTQSVKADPLGISFNNLGLVYNLTSRKVQDSLAIIPMDLDKNGRVDPDEAQYETLDGIIAFAEKSDVRDFARAPVNFIFDKDRTAANSDALLFAEWVLSQGQSYNHDAGFLNLAEQTVQKQQLRIALLH